MIIEYVQQKSALDLCSQNAWVMCYQRVWRKPAAKNNVNEMDSTGDTAQERLVITAVFISSW